MRRPRHRKPGCAAAVGAVLLTAAALGCTPGGAGAPDVVLVSIDTLRADRIGSYGAGRDTSPNIDRLAAEGARFAAAFAPTSWTLPSHMTLLTGLGIFAHRVSAVAQRLDPQRRTIAQELSDLGYRTAAFVSAPLLHRAYGFDRGFGIYRNFGVPEAAPAFPPTRSQQRASHHDETAEQVIGAAIAWLDSEPVRAGQPVFLFVHLWDPHYDYVPPEPYDRLFDPGYRGDLDVRDYEERIEINALMSPRDLNHLRALYDGEIRWTDSQLGRLVEALRRRGRFDETVFALVSDHGEEFFEHGRRGHKQTVYDESVHVPWILRFPPRIAAGTVVRSTASLADVAPTLLDLAGLPPLADSTGRSQLPELAGRQRPEVPVLLSVEQTTALRGSGWKVAQQGDRAVYFDLRADPAERDGRPAADAAPERLAQLERRLAAEREFAARLSWDGAEPVKLDAATQARLRELGYVEGEGPLR